VFDKLGISMEIAFFVLISSLLGSLINIPLFTIRSSVPMQPVPEYIFRLLRTQHLIFKDKTTVAVNVGGCLIPVFCSFYLIFSTDISLIQATFGTAFVSTISYVSSRPIQGLGIGMPILVAPLSAALVALLVNPESSAALAYVSGTLGVLIGADVFHLKDIRQLGTPLASIGGAGTFDGIFITGIVAVLLA
jgi:uncharacterized membrane protein